MNEVTSVSYSDTGLSWLDRGEPRSIVYDQEVAHALAIGSGGIAVCFQPENKAMILNHDGSLRAELINPFDPITWPMYFSYFYYERERLTIMFDGAGMNWRCHIDEATGQLSAPIESR